MKNNIIPVFYDHSSKKSILTYDKPSDVTAKGPRSIVKLCKDAGINEVYGVSDNFSTFITAYKNCRDAGLKFRFGLEMWLCDDAKVHTEESLDTEHKVIIFAKNSKAYQDLIKIYSACRTTRDNFYYKFRFDFNQLNALWTENLTLALPFFDSFIQKNNLSYNSRIIPKFPVKPIIFREQSCEHPQQSLTDTFLDSYNTDNQYEEVKTKTIFYEKRKHLDQYTVYRCIHNRGNKSDFDDPKLEFFCSPEFCLESYLELTK